MRKIFASSKSTLSLILFAPIVLCAMQPQANDSSMNINPRKALLYSALLPGLGQIYVKKPLKAGLYIAAEAYNIYQFYSYNRIYNYVKETKDAIGQDIWSSLTEQQKKDSVYAYTGYELTLNSWRPREKRNKYGWWCIGVYLFQILDAYVDAHLFNFPQGKVELTLSPSKPAEQAIGVNLALYLRR